MQSRSYHSMVPRSSSPDSSTTVIGVWVCICFFFASRRRHTRFDCDWSSDVCSSDLEELVVSKPGPAAVDASAAHAAAENEHRRRVTVIGAAVSVLGDGPAELRHREDDDVRHLVAEVLGEGRERGAEVAEAQRELAALGALANVRVPALHVGEGDLEADVGLDELGDLAQRLAERHARILGAVRRRDARGPGALEYLHRVERLAPRSVQEIANALLVERLETLSRGAVVAVPNVESVERLH